jgi:vancomycin resistance protein YoaR
MSRMKQSSIAILSASAILAIGLVFVSVRGSRQVRANTYIGPVAVGSVSREAAIAKLGHWWDEEKLKPLQLQSATMAHSVTVSASELGIGLDAQKSLHQASNSSILDSIRKPKTQKFAPLYVVDEAALSDLLDRLNGNLKSPSRAKVFLVAGKFHAMRESGHAEVDSALFRKRLINALSRHATVEVPFVEAPKRVSDADLASIHEVVGEFTTHFPTYKKNRCSNIQLASSKLNGIVLMPGDRLSFNGTVGRRTPEAGFQIAGVYKNGKHDFDVGGGICQVSTTLYNASLFADLKIIHRHNHSMPVAYVPLGRDATVDYGALDLEVENTTGHPIAVNSEFHPGKLTFRILGTKQPGLDVKIESSGASSWDGAVQVVSDPALAPGARKVVDKGGSGKQISTFRDVYVDGKLVRREALGTSTYKGGTRIIAVGPTMAAKPSPSIRLASNSH